MEQKYRHLARKEEAQTGVRMLLWMFVVLRNKERN